MFRFGAWGAKDGIRGVHGPTCAPRLVYAIRILTRRGDLLDGPVNPLVYHYYLLALTAFAYSRFNPPGITGELFNRLLFVSHGLCLLPHLVILEFPYRCG